MRRASAAVADWSGGTRLGEALLRTIRGTLDGRLPGDRRHVGRVGSAVLAAEDVLARLTRCDDERSDNAIRFPSRQSGAAENYLVSACYPSDWLRPHLPITGTQAFHTTDFVALD
jgi:hypothetical protein